MRLVAMSFFFTPQRKKSMSRSHLFFGRTETHGVTIEDNPELEEYGIPTDHRERERERERERMEEALMG